MKRIKAENVSKKFMIGFKKNQSALQRFIELFSGVEPRRVIWAVRDVSVSVEKGKITALVGKNGSGKSTFLRIVAGIYRQEEGTVDVHGKILSLISLSAGLREKMTMQDNVWLCCSLFGLSSSDMRKRFDSIIEFAELEDFLNTKIYQFSEGMKQRLVFSIAVHCDSDILLLDEIFGVGDIGFRQKSVEKIQELVGQGKSVLIASHDMNMVETYCHNAVWLEKGRVRLEGGAKEVVRAYRGH